MKRYKTKVLGLVLIFLILSIAWFISSKNLTSPTFAQKESGFSADNAYEHVKYLTQKIGPRPAGSKSEIKAAQYIYYILQQNGWKVREQSFSKVVLRGASIVQQEQSIDLISSQNIIAELPGTLPDTVVIGAHYDTANFNAPGAVDNASGVGVLLELARVLSQEPHEQTYQIVFFGAEEYGLVGSQFFTSQADLSAVRWMLNIDMVGSPIEIDVAGKKSAPTELINQVTKLAKESNLPFHVSRDFIVMTRDSSQGGVSDFSSFLDQDIPALGLGVAGRPSGYYHRPEDQLNNVSLEDMQKVGNFAYSLVSTVTMKTMGPNPSDDLYLPFQVGSNVFILPSLGIRVFILITFLFTGWLLIRFFTQRKEKHRVYFIRALGAFGLALVLSIIVMGLSGVGENLWIWIKQAQQLWYAYPAFFLAVRLGIALGVLIFIASWCHKAPIVLDAQCYWLVGVMMLLIISILLTLIRIDLAFPFVFWLLCMDLQFILPSIFIVLIGPYFIYWLHVELMNSQQWVSYYGAIHDYFLIFLGTYALLLVPLILALLHVTISNKHRWIKWIRALRKPAIVIVSILILSIGLVPTYTKGYPQTIKVSQEWVDQSEGKIHIYSDINLPIKLLNELNAPKGKSLFLPTLEEKAPMIVETTVIEQNNDLERSLNLTLKLKYTNEPYLVRIKLESAHPFEVQTDEFMPISKLPKKLQLKGIQSSSGVYTLTMQRTPPQRNLIQLSVKTEGKISCTVESTFSDPSPSTKIEIEGTSVDYQIWFKQSLEL